jgi:hypothetical protein
VHLYLSPVFPPPPPLLLPLLLSFSPYPLPCRLPAPRTRPRFFLPHTHFPCPSCPLSLLQCVCCFVSGGQGDRLVVLRFFDALSRALANGSAACDGDFTPAMFDWAPRPVGVFPASLCFLLLHPCRAHVWQVFGTCHFCSFPFPVQLPEAFLASLLPRPAESLEAGVTSLVQLVTSQYDDVAVNGCSSVAKLAAANESTSLHLATSVPLLQSLVGVVAGDLSLDTLTNAALALAELTSQPAGQEALVTKCDGPKVVGLLVDKCSIPVDEEEDVDVVCFKRYW